MLKFAAQTVFTSAIFALTACGPSDGTSAELTTEQKYEQGMVYWIGDDADISSEMAAEYLTPACDEGHGRACFYLGLRHDSRDKTKSDEFYARSIALDEESCEKGNSISCYNLSYAFLFGLGVESDRILSKAYADRAVGPLTADCEEAKSGAACAAAAELYTAIYNFEDDEEAATTANQFYIKACDLENANSCMEASENYFRGRGVEFNIAEGVKFFTKACDLDKPSACSFLSEIMLDEEASQQYEGHIEFNHENGLKLLEKSCELGLQESCETLAELFHDGLPAQSDQAEIVPDKSKSIHFLQIGCQARGSTSCRELQRYATGYNDIDETTLASTVFDKRTLDQMQVFCDKSRYGGECFDLGYIYLVGVVTTLNEEQGSLYLTKACSLGHSGACELAD